MTQDDLTRHEEELTPDAYDADARWEPKFGNWPEVAGVLLTLALIWMSFAFRG
ncbi:hypothetical protein [Acidimangrovimonas sediminis]|uniref:hypothetical protein n=1 Tax=Acidimangrovimonas sediminis TaxID=2056283 RepID=UPI0013048716|nr:hypothetical protein [Acidimangrovimonas sediminis]